MRDHNAQRPVYLFTASNSRGPLFNEGDQHEDAASFLRFKGASFKVVREVTNGKYWFVVPEEFKEAVYDICNDRGQEEVIYLDFARVAYLKTKDQVASGTPIGQFSNTDDIHNWRECDTYENLLWRDECHNSDFVITRG